MKKRFCATSCAGLLATSFFCLPSAASAKPEFTAGVWFVYQNVTQSEGAADDLDNTTGGNFADPAFILYANDNNSYGPWHFEAEFRIGTGSFTDVNNNNSGDHFAMHEAWIGYDVTDHSILKVGKTQVPFGWKTVNFWPGDGLQGGYGDQMDVGFKYSADLGDVHYDLAYYHQDDWGETSTDTVDDNGHWGTSDTYRKIKTGVVNLAWTFVPHHTIGASYQYGRMQDLVPVAAGNPGDSNDNGTHQEYDLYYIYEQGPWSLKYRYTHVRRDFGGMSSLLASAKAPVSKVIKNQRHTAEVGYHHGNWFFYLDGGVASSQTRNNHADRVEFAAPGARYKYGPGWIYFEYLQSNGDINTWGDTYEGDFDALYVAIDFYF